MPPGTWNATVPYVSDMAGQTVEFTVTISIVTVNGMGQQVPQGPASYNIQFTVANA